MLGQEHGSAAQVRLNMGSLTPDTVPRSTADAVADRQHRTAGKLEGWSGTDGVLGAEEWKRSKVVA